MQKRYSFRLGTKIARQHLTDCLVIKPAPPKDLSADCLLVILPTGRQTKINKLRLRRNLLASGNLAHLGIGEKVKKVDKRTFRVISIVGPRYMSWHGASTTLYKHTQTDTQTHTGTLHSSLLDDVLRQMNKHTLKITTQLSRQLHTSLHLTLNKSI